MDEAADWAVEIISQIEKFIQPLVYSRDYGMYERNSPISYSPSLCVALYMTSKYGSVSISQRFKVPAFQGPSVPRSPR